MTGTFAKWQPIYAEAGIATFPVDGHAKKPAVGNYLKGGLPASREWARKFSDASALGIACGRRNRLTVLDIDSPDEGLLGRALDKFGDTPIIIRTASGKFHAWYRHNGEGRKIRTAMPGEPVDVLGNGFALAPPSRGSVGSYEFISGSLADLKQLPRMTAQTAAPSAPPAVSTPDITLVGQGERNNMLYRACMVQAPLCAGLDQLMDFAQALNRSGFVHPLGDEELRRTVANSWAMEESGRNWFGTGRRVVSTHDEVDGLMQDDPDAYLLLTKLRRHHWGDAPFVIANQMHEVMPGGGWTRKRLAAARASLELRGLVLLIRKHSKANGPAIYRFS